MGVNPIKSHFQYSRVLQSQLELIMHEVLWAVVCNISLPFMRFIFMKANMKLKEQFPFRNVIQCIG